MELVKHLDRNHHEVATFLQDDGPWSIRDKYGLDYEIGPCRPSKYFDPDTGKPISEAHMPGMGTTKAPQTAPPGAVDQATVADQRLKGMWGAQRFHGPAPGQQTGSTGVDDYRNPRLPLPARPPVGSITGPAGWGNGDPYFTVPTPRVPGSPWGGGGAPLLSNPGDGTYSSADDIPEAKATGESPGFWERLVGFFTGNTQRSDGGSGGGGNGNTDYNQYQLGSMYAMNDYYGRLNSDDPTEEYTPPPDEQARRQFLLEHPDLSAANLAGTATEIGFDIATTPVTAPVQDAAFSAIFHGIGAAIGLAKFGRYSKYADDVYNVARISRRAENWESVTSVLARANKRGKAFLPSQVRKDCRRNFKAVKDWSMLTDEFLADSKVDRNQIEQMRSNFYEVAKGIGEKKVKYTGKYWNQGSTTQGGGVVDQLPLGEYKEFDVPTPRNWKAGNARIVVNEQGMAYATTEHYEGFIRLF